MIMWSYCKTGKYLNRSGFTLIEAVLSTIIVGAMLVAALNTVGASRLSQYKTSQRSRGQLLAQMLIAEILQQSYGDPDSGQDSFGLEIDETGDGSRSLWDDVDDYDGWSESPPKYKDGTEMSDLQSWQRSVQVKWIDPVDLSSTVDTNQGIKRITVTIKFGNIEVASLTGIRTAWGL